MRRRSGFTITELLVAMALIVFVMSILATAFSEGMKTFRALKGLGDMNQRLRTASTLMTEDLQSPHFEGRRRLSDPGFWLTGKPGEFGPPREGFVRIWQGSALSTTPGAPYFNEYPGGDVDYQIDSVRATDHILHLTVKKLGNDPKNFFHNGVPVNSPLVTFGNYNGRYQDQPLFPVQGLPASTPFTSQWAEVAWFLRANGQNANGTPLFTLYRRQRIIVANPETGGSPQVGTPGVNLNWFDPAVGPAVAASSYNDLSGTGVNYLGVSCRVKNNLQVYFNSPSDLTVPQYRFAMQPGVYGGLPAATDPITGQPTYFVFQPQGTGDVNEEQTNPNLQGSDAILTDVVSFSIRVMTPTSGGFVDLPALGASANPLFGGAKGPYVYDTWTSVADDQVDYSLWNNTTATDPKNMKNVTQLLQVRPPLQTPITAIQIQLRVWDIKTEQSRQMTILVDM
jgi:prepilin-type N-terminal cleavage/methylation domain-containing protein